MTTDPFDDPRSPGLPYARGALVTSTADDLQKLRVAWGHIRRRIEAHGAESLFIMNGLERGMKIDAVDIPLLDDEIGPALLEDEVRDQALAQLGGDATRHDILLCNRLTAALLVAGDVMVREGDTVIGVSPRYSHPAVQRAIAHGRGRFTDCAGVEAFRRAMSTTPRVALVVLTRLSVSYEILGEEDLHEIVRLAKKAGARLLLDDAGGARVGPAVFDQTKSLALGADVACTGLDKYGTVGPRLGLVGGDRAVLARMRARAFEMGLEARPMLYPAVLRSLQSYRPQRVRDMVAATGLVRDALRDRLPAGRIWTTPVTVQLRAEDVLELAMERRGLKAPPCVPYEATAGLAMILLRDHGILTVHFAGMPPGTAALMFKFIAPETLERFGGAGKVAAAVDEAITALSTVIDDRRAFRDLLLGSDSSVETVSAASREPVPSA